jgi:hypothetical protein
MLRPLSQPRRHRNARNRLRTSFASDRLLDTYRLDHRLVAHRRRLTSFNEIRYHDIAIETCTRSSLLSECTFTSDFVRAGTEGGRSLGIETAIEYWRLLLPAGLQGGALAHIPSEDETDENGWTVEYIQWWLDFLSEKGAKGVSKDIWMMVCPLSPLFLLLIDVTVSGFRADN